MARLSCGAGCGSGQDTGCGGGRARVPSRGLVSEQGVDRGQPSGGCAAVSPAVFQVLKELPSGPSPRSGVEATCSALSRSLLACEQELARVAVAATVSGWPSSAATPVGEESLQDRARSLTVSPVLFLLQAAGCRGDQLGDGPGYR